jgi:peptidyl-tRNA hydrolase
LCGKSYSTVYKWLKDGDYHVVIDCNDISEIKERMKQCQVMKLESSFGLIDKVFRG